LNIQGLDFARALSSYTVFHVIPLTKKVMLPTSYLCHGDAVCVLWGRSSIR